MQRAVGYCRRSDKKQEGNHSVEIQKMSMEAAAVRLGIEIDEFFIDDAVSAFAYNASERSEMKRLKSRVINDLSISVVLFYDESRVSRQVTDFVNEIYTEIKELRPDVKFYSADGSSHKEWDPNDPITIINFVLANEESSKKSSRAIDSQKIVLNKDVPTRPGAKPPYGMMKEGDTLVHNDQAPIVYLIFHLASWGYSEDQIAQCLNRAEIPSPSNGLWASSSINMILSKRIYLGDLEWYVRKGRKNGARSNSAQISMFTDVYEPIIPLDLWTLVQELKTEKRTTKRKMNSRHTLQGLLKCGHCHSTFLHKNYTPAKSEKQYVIYKCESCGYRLESKVVEEQIIEKISMDWGIHPNWFLQQAHKMLEGWVRLLEGEISNYKNRLQQAEAYLKSTHLNPEIEDSIEAVRQLIAEKEKLQTQISLLLSKDEVLWRTRFGDQINLQLLNTTELRTVLFQIVEVVQIRRNARGDVMPNIVYRVTPFTNLNIVMNHSKGT
ncbi:recombinase family protein [Ferroacidibacillus organovorans]|nr:recombinase family protein [Ferroacidibacillus organovorans]